MKIKKALLLLVIQTLILVLLLGGAGVFSVNDLKKNISEEMFYLEELEQISSTLKEDLITNRRWEKDLFLNVGIPLQQEIYFQKFNESSDTVSLLLMNLSRKLDRYPELKQEYDDKLLLSVQEFTLYSSAVATIFTKSLTDNSLTPQDLNSLMVPYKEHIYDCESNVFAIDSAITNLHNSNFTHIVKLSNQYSVLVSLLAVVSALILTIILLFHRSHVTKGINLLDYKIEEFASGSFNLSNVMSWERNDEFKAIVSNLNIFMENLRKVYSRVAESEEHLRITLNSIGDGVVVTDSSGKIIQINPIAEKLSEITENYGFGKQIDDMIHLFTNKIKHNISPIIETMANTANSVNFETVHFESTLVSTSGTSYEVSTSVSAIKHHDGSLFGSVLVFRDITLEQNLKERVAQSDKMDSIGQLAGGVAHDFNNMLGGISGAAELLLMDSHDKDQDVYINLIINTATRAAAINSKLLAFSRKSISSSTPFSMNSVVNDAVDILKHTIDKKVRVVFTNSAENDTVIGDSAQVQNAILNLGINSRDAIGNNGIISITTENISLTDTYTKQIKSSLLAGEYIRITIEDNGCGMSNETKQRIFEPFYTTKDIGQGTGLGLSAVFGIVKEHEGDISVYSEQGVGTTFNILLPITVEKHIEKLTEEQIITGSGTILIVDDEDTLRTVAGSILKNAGYSILYATNGKEGVEIFMENKDTINLVLLDMIMPEMDGRDCFKKINAIAPTLPVIMASGYTSDLRVQEIKELGVKALLSKPYRATELASSVYTNIKEFTTNN